MADSSVQPFARASRTKREPWRGARLWSRDLDVLLALARMRLLSTSQLTRLFFRARGTCQKRMRKLFDAGLVRPIVTDLASENRYALTRLGHEFLVEAAEGAPVPTFRSPPRVDRRGLVHHDLLNDVRISLALCAAENGVKLVKFAPDWDLRAIAPTAPIVPDAIIVLEHAKQSWHLALEIDTGTESASVFGRKLSRYCKASDDGQLVSGTRDPLILVVTHTERRGRTLARQAVIARTSRAIFAWKESILANGGLMSGLAYATDLTDDQLTKKAVAWTRGLMRPEGVLVK